MRTCWKNGIGLLALTLVAAIAMLAYSGQSAAQREGGAHGRYTVVATDGSHIIAVDNAAAKLYFYAIDQGGKVGDELKLRGTVDLQDIGKPTLKPIDARPAK